MKRLSGPVGTIVWSVLTVCFSMVCCAAGIYVLADECQTMGLGATAGVPMVLLGIVLWIVPPLASVRSRAIDGEDTEDG